MHSIRTSASTDTFPPLSCTLVFCSFIHDSCHCQLRNKAEEREKQERCLCRVTIPYRPLMSEKERKKKNGFHI